LQLEAGQFYIIEGTLWTLLVRFARVTRLKRVTSRPLARDVTRRPVWSVQCHPHHRQDSIYWEKS